MNPNFRKDLVVAVLIISSSPLYAAGMSAGETLLEPTSARPAAMGEAFTAVTNDIAAFGYNPASLNTLETGQMSFMYEKGMADDAYGQFMIGSPRKTGGLGFSVGYYNGGSMEITDSSLNTRTVTAKSDLTTSLGYAMKMGSLSVGITGKYISSELIDQYSANAFAGDVGLQMPVSSRIRFGAAIQNVGSQLKYVEKGNDLPQIARAGLGISLFPNSYQTTLLLDAPYYMKDEELRAGLGIETLVGPIALRAGYRSGNKQTSLTFGAGFMLGSMTLDYAYGLVQDLESSHRVSLGLKFGEGSAPKNQNISRAPQQNVPHTSEPAVTFVQRHSMSDQKRGEFKSLGREVYVVRPGDSLGKIAQNKYGDTQMWTKIYAANKHLLGEGKSLEAGQRIVLP